MPDFGYKVKRFGWLKDYPSVRDYGPQEAEQRLISELRTTSEKKGSAIKSVLGSTKTYKSTLPGKVDNRKYCSPVKDQGQLGSCTANMAANMYEYMSFHLQDYTLVVTPNRRYWRLYKERTWRAGSLWCTTRRILPL
jgi:hypothetical protein